ncbi:MAG: hypothetical protein AAF196_03305 [Planctomycetota bacterium]
MSKALLLAAAVVAAPALSAQINPAVGAPLGVGDDTETMVTLSFGFTFPDGVAVTDIFVDSNGRIVSAQQFGGDFSESVGEFLSEASSLAPYWDDLNPPGQGGDVFFNDLGTSALLTWQDVIVFGGAAGTEFTVQVELFDDGSFKYRYDSRTPLGANDGLVGCTQGGGAADPGSTDLTAGVSSAGDPTVYEQFVAGDNDLNDGELCFAPDGSGGYDVTSTIGVLVPASIDAVLPGCDILGATLVFTPNGGGYDVGSGAGGFADADFAMGTDIGAGDDSNTMVTVAATIAWPDGTTGSDIWVDSNGRVLNADSGSDFSESVAELLGDASGVAVIWDDLSPNLAGAVWVHDNANGVSVTWDNVPQFGGTDSNNAQVQFNNDGSIVVAHPAVALADCLVGVTAGNGAVDPGATDLSAGAVGGGATVYEQYAGDYDLGAQVPFLSGVSLPIIGASWDLSIDQVTGSAIQEIYLIGFPTSFDLSSIGGVNCTLLCDGSLLTFGLAPGTGLSFGLPNNPALVSLALRVQGATLDGAAGSLPIFLTEAVDVTVGEF